MTVSKFCYPGVTPDAINDINSEGVIPRCAVNDINGESVSRRRKMARGFTDIEIRNLQAGDTRREVPDPGASNLYVVIQPSGKKSFCVRYRFNGKPRKLTLKSGVSLAGARKLAGDAMYEVEQGRDPAETKKDTRAKLKAAKANTVQALCESYLKREGGKLRTEHARKLVLERLVYPAIGCKPLADLKRSHIVDMLDDIEDESGTKMSDLVLAYLRKIFNWHAGRVDDFNSPVVQGMGRYDAKANQGTRVLTDGELRTLWNATEPNENEPQPFHALIRFVLLTGCRRAEATGLRWSEITGTIWLLPAARNKTKADLPRPLSEAAQAVLKSLPVIEGGDIVFSNDGRRTLHLTSPTEQLKTTIGVSDWRIHDLRRTARTLLSRAGVNSDVAERCLGHTIGGVRGVYDKHKYEKEMAQAYEALAALIERIADPPAGQVVNLRGAR
jgi:integrase